MSKVNLEMALNLLDAAKRTVQDSVNRPDDPEPLERALETAYVIATASLRISHHLGYVLGSVGLVQLLIKELPHSAAALEELARFVTGGESNCTVVLDRDTGDEPERDIALTVTRRTRSWRGVRYTFFIVTLEPWNEDRQELAKRWAEKIGQAVGQEVLITGGK